MERIQFLTTMIAALGSGLIAGTFFVFSVAVMRALGQRPANEGMAAMQAINIVILNPTFLGVFLGTTIVSTLAALFGVLWKFPGSGYLLAGAASYVLGSFVITMVVNVPLNNALIAADPASDTGQKLWKNYLTVWTRWNHVRTIASLAALFCFIM